MGSVRTTWSQNQNDIMNTKKVQLDCLFNNLFNKLATKQIGDGFRSQG